MPSKNLEPGQYQLGDFVFGTGTQLNVEKFDIGGWEVNVQDQQAQLSDEIRFGADSFKPSPIQIEMTYTRNRILPNVAALLENVPPMDFTNDRRIGDFTREWRADEIRKEWGELKPLYICRPDGRTVMCYGRPGKLAVSREMPRSLTRKLVAEFRRADTLAYNEFEWYLASRKGESHTVYRTSQLGQGDGPSWMRLILVGPMEHPIINVGDLTIELDWELDAGEVVEISGYPWARRVVRLNDGLNLSAYLVRPYLDKLHFDVDKPYEFSWNAANSTGQTESLDFADYTDTAEGLPPGDWFPTVYSPGAEGRMRINGGELQWNDDGNDTELGVSIFREPTISEYQVAGFTMANPAEAGIVGAEPTNRIIGRADGASATEYLFWEISFTKFWYGYHKDGIDYQLSPTYSIGSHLTIISRIIKEFFNSLFGIETNWTYEAEFGTGASPFSSTLRVNGVHLHTFDDSMATLPVTVGDNRFTGIGMKATPRALGQSTPGTVSNFWVRDNHPDPEATNVSGVILFWRDAWQNI